MRLPDFWTGLVFCLLGIAIALHARSFHVPAGAASPRLFPMIVGGAMALMGGAITLRGWRSAGTFRFPPWLRSPQRLALVLWLPLSILGFALLAPRWGTIAVAVPLMVVHGLLYGMSLPRAVLTGAVGATVLAVFFIKFLGVPLPYGLIEEWL